MRLRSVHSLCSFRSRLYVHFEILIHYDSLHSIPLSFISPTSAPHGISGSVTTLHKSTLSFHFVQRLLIHARRKPCKLCKICSLPPTKATSWTSFHSSTHCAIPLPRHLCPFPTHYQWYIFLSLRRVSPKRYKRQIGSKERMNTSKACVLRRSANIAYKWYW